jgi:hypothetical protein
MEAMNVRRVVCMAEILTRASGAQEFSKFPGHPLAIDIGKSKRAIQRKSRRLRRHNFKLKGPDVATTRLIGDMIQNRTCDAGATRVRNDVELFHPQDQPGFFDADDLIGEKDGDRRVILKGQQQHGRRMRRQCQSDPMGDTCRICFKMMLDKLSRQKLRANLAIRISGRPNEEGHTDRF